MCHMTNLLIVHTKEHPKCKHHEKFVLYFFEWMNKKMGPCHSHYMPRNITTQFND